LEVEPSTLPDQVAVESVKRSYSNVLNSYLEKHHGLMYSELQEFQILGVQVRDPGWGVLLGPTVRSATNGGRSHAIVGRYGEPVWDPHPSRAGLLKVERWGLLVPLLDSIKAFRESRRQEVPQEWPDLFCSCPKCSG
jgi:hypothetical protein